MNIIQLNYIELLILFKLPLTFCGGYQKRNKLKYACTVLSRENRANIIFYIEKKQFYCKNKNCCI